MYSISTSHSTTLDILARSSSYSEIAIEDIREYCKIAKDEFGAENMDEAAVILQGRYGWDVKSRLEDFAAAWKRAEHAGSNCIDADNVVGAPTIAQVPDRVALVLKKDLPVRTTLLCEVNDDKLCFRGDSGAIGRLIVNDSRLCLDLKGRRYGAEIRQAPLVMLVNFSKGMNDNETIGKTELITNEVCRFKFENDVLSALKGAYSGINDISSIDVLTIPGDGYTYLSDSDSDDIQTSTKRKQQSRHDPSDENEYTKDAKNNVSTIKTKKPKISTITHRRRTSKAGKVSKKKK